MKRARSLSSFVVRFFLLNRLLCNYSLSDYPTLVCVCEFIANLAQLDHYFKLT